MAYFSNFVLDAYDFKIATERSRKTVLLVDILRNVRLRRDTLENILIFDLYRLQDGETPEILSERLYGTPYYHWTLMLANERFDYATDFPLSQLELEEYVEQKYGNPDGIHHYETVEIKNSKGLTMLPAGLKVDENFSYSYTESNGVVTFSGLNAVIPITNYEYELRVNEEKRVIKVLAPETIQELFTKFKELMA
jgi:hypothetical protein